MRRAGSFSEQFPLLFRDYRRSHREEEAAYATLKHRAAAEFHHDRAAYTNAKVPFFWEVSIQADRICANPRGLEPAIHGLLRRQAGLRRRRPVAGTAVFGFGYLAAGFG